MLRRRTLRRGRLRSRCSASRMSQQRRQNQSRHQQQHNQNRHNPKQNLFTHDLYPFLFGISHRFQNRVIAIRLAPGPPQFIAHRGLRIRLSCLYPPSQDAYTLPGDAPERRAAPPPARATARGTVNDRCTPHPVRQRRHMNWEDPRNPYSSENALNNLFFTPSTPPLEVKNNSNLDLDAVFGTQNFFAKPPTTSHVFYQHHFHPIHWAKIGTRFIASAPIHCKMLHITQIIEIIAKIYKPRDSSLSTIHCALVEIQLATFTASRDLTAKVPPSSLRPPFRPSRPGKQCRESMHAILCLEIWPPQSSLFQSISSDALFSTSLAA